MKTYNGDEIIHAISPEDWIEAANKKVGCYYILDNGNFIYNGYVLNDSRSILPNDYRLPTKEDFEEMYSFIGGDFKNSEIISSSVSEYDYSIEEYYKEKGLIEKTIKGNNDFGFGASEAGFVYPNGTINYGACTYWWTNSSSEVETLDNNLNTVVQDGKFVVDIGYCSQDIGGGIGSYSLDFGFSIRLIHN